MRCQRTLPKDPLTDQVLPLHPGLTDDLTLGDLIGLLFSGLKDPGYVGLSISSVYFSGDTVLIQKISSHYDKSDSLLPGLWSRSNRVILDLRSYENPRVLL